MKTKGFSLLVLILMLSAIMFLSACSGSSDEASQSTDNEETEINAEDATIKSDGNKVEYESNDGKTSFEAGTEGSVDLPEGYPSDIVPIYPNGRVTLAGRDGEGYAVAIVTDDSISDVLKYYKENTSLDEVAEQQTEDMAMIMGTAKGMNVTVMVTANNLYDEGENLISIAMGK